MTELQMHRKDQVFLITGATSGVGKAIATGLAKAGARIVIIGRTAEDGQAALSDIARASNNDRGEFLVADLSLQSSIRKVSEEFKRKYDNVHVLANVAGFMGFEKEVTAEGIDKTVAVNYLSHFLLTHELLDVLKESQPSRVMTVAGAPGFLKKPKIDFADFQFEKSFSGIAATTQVLHARTLFAFELAKRLRGSGVTSVAFHPGLVKSRLVRKGPAWIRLYNFFAQRRAKEDCHIGVYLATAKELETTSGVFYDDKKQILPIFAGYNEDMGRTLWRISEDLTKVEATA